ncbi:MAG: DegV family protein [Candidatus Heimdallarchaeota archaeon]|nr:DegV family protein [Candidatus Heimdallarchaeota archaeon]
MEHKFGIITDSGADFSLDYQKKHNLILIPTRIIVDGVEYIDRENLFREDVIDMMKNDKAKTSTSVAPPIEFHNIISDSLEKYEDVLFLSISSKMSATLQNALLTAKRLKTDNFTAIDSESASWGMSLLLDHAIMMRNQGATIKETVDDINFMKKNLELYFMVDTLEYLRRGGRIGAAKSFLGKLIGAKPILTVKDGEISPVETVKSFKEALEFFYHILEQKSKEYKNYSIAIIYGIGSPEFKEFAAQIKHDFKPNKFFYEPIGANIISHAGPEVFGFGIIKLPEK